MRKILLAITLCILPFLSKAQGSKEIDSTAIYILDKMSDIIGDLESVNYNVTISEDKLNAYNLIETHFRTSSVSMVGPDKLTARTINEKGGHGIWFDGELFSYYSFAENNYVTLETPGNIISMIDNMHQRFDFKFPAADFFYPSFTDDILEEFDRVKYIGKKVVEEEECFHIIAENKNINVQLWISNKTLLLPKQLVIIYKNENNMQYKNTFTNWDLNPNIPEAVFNFLPPNNAKLISILEKNNN